MHWFESLQLPLILTDIIGCVVVGDCVVVVGDSVVVVIDSVVVVVDCTELCIVDASVPIEVDCVVLLVT